MLRPTNMDLFRNRGYPVILMYLIYLFAFTSSEQLTPSNEFHPRLATKEVTRTHSEKSNYPFGISDLSVQVVDHSYRLVLFKWTVSAHSATNIKRNSYLCTTEQKQLDEPSHFHPCDVPAHPDGTLSFKTHLPTYDAQYFCAVRTQYENKHGDVLSNIATVVVRKEYILDEADASTYTIVAIVVSVILLILAILRTCFWYKRLQEVRALRAVEVVTVVEEPFPRDNPNFVVDRPPPYPYQGGIDHQYKSTAPPQGTGIATGWGQYANGVHPNATTIQAQQPNQGLPSTYYQWERH